MGVLNMADMTQTRILHDLVEKYPDFAYLPNFGWYRREESGFMVHIDAGVIEQELLQDYYDEAGLNLKQMTSAVRLFEMLHGQDCKALAGKFFFTNEQTPDRYLTRIDIPLERHTDVTECLQWCEQVYPQNDVLLAQVGGYILFHPDNNYQKVFLMTGPGGNGKGTFLRIFNAILEEHISGEPLACSVDFDDFGKHERIEILGKQLIYDPDISGNAKTQRWVKILSGGDRVTASQKFKQPITFYPTCKLLLLSNPIPDWQSNPALLRRIIHLRFARKFKVDPKFEERLLAPAMLQKWVAFFWHGYQDFKKHGFRLVEENNAAELFAETDNISAFLQDRCVLGDNYEIPAITLYDAFLRFWRHALQDTRPADNSRVLGKRLKECGIDRKRNATLTKEQIKTYRLTKAAAQTKRFDVYKGLTLSEFVA